MRPYYTDGKRGRPTRGIETMLRMYLLQVWFNLSNEEFFKAINRVMKATGHIMHGGTIIDATIINAPSSTKNAEKKRDPKMHQTKEGNEWRFGMKCNIGVDAGSGLVHSITAASANVQ